jgi:DNA-binding NtrC family response regulator
MQNLVVTIPPLRERREQIPELASNIVRNLRFRHEVTGCPDLPAAEIAWAQARAWRGNVRELERLLWRWVFEGGRRPLADIQAEYPHDDLEANGSTSVRRLVAAQVRQALASSQKLAGSAADFVDQITEDARRALCESLDGAACARLFGDGGKSAKRLSEWRGKAKGVADADPPKSGGATADRSAEAESESQ